MSTSGNLRQTERAGPELHARGLLETHRKEYPRLSRGELAKRDISLYMRLRRAGLLRRLPLRRRVIDDPIGYYWRHYGGVPGWRLRRRDPTLYRRLQRDGLRMHASASA